MKPIKILYAEDDETLAFLTKDNLELHHYDVTHCTDGSSCLDLFKQQKFDICIFDIMLPKMDGFQLTSEIRKIDPEIPIVFLSSKILKEDRIKGLRLGADDYLVKPFSIEELLLKIGIFLARSKKMQQETAKVYQVGAYTFDAEECLMQNGSEKINLTQRESELLRLFLDNKNKTLKREEILKALWGDDDYFLGRSLDVFVSRLRKLIAHDNNLSIENQHGVGFKLSDKTSRPER